MVLESSTADGAPPSDDSFSDQSSYEGSDQIGPRTYEINTDGFARPIPIIAPIFGFGPAVQAKAITARIEGFSRMIKRSLTDDEANAVAYHTAKQFSILSYGAPVGILGGISQAMRTAESFKFPFYSPNAATFPKESFPSAHYPLVTGKNAVNSWHLLRGGCYGFVGYFLAMAIFGSYALSVTAANEYRDTRLVHLIKAMRANAPNARIHKDRIPNQPRQPGMVDGAQQKDVSTLWADYSKEISGGGNAPSSSSEEGMHQTNYDAPSQSSNAPYATMPRTSNRPARVDTRPRENEPNESQSFFGDDASPTGGQGMQQDIQGGSAWDRIRRQSTTQTSTNKTTDWSRTQASTRQAQQGEPTSTDAYAFSNEDRDRQTAKSEAQREFDARVERERRGGNFNNSNDQKRW